MFRGDPKEELEIGKLLDYTLKGVDLAFFIRIFIPSTKVAVLTYTRPIRLSFGRVFEIF